MSANVPPYDPQNAYSRGEQPPYGQDGPSPYGPSPYAQQPPPPPLPGSSSRWGPTSIGIDPAIAAGLGYLFGGHFAGILPIIWLVAERSNRFIRFHAAQALLLLGAALVGAVLGCALLVVGIVIGTRDLEAGGTVVAVSVILLIALGLAVAVLDIWGIIAGFSGKYVKFPLIGNLAERLVGGPATPLY
jgi:uncharacterized membrane protein